jgi:hypothetical protein
MPRKHQCNRDAKKLEAFVEGTEMKPVDVKFLVFFGGLYFLYGLIRDVPIATACGMALLFVAISTLEGKDGR